MAVRTVTFPGGKKVTFRKQARAGKKKPNAYARYVAKNIKKYSKKGVKPTTAMKRVAAAWRAEK